MASPEWKWERGRLRDRMGEYFRNWCGGMVTHLKYLECLVECGQDEEKLGVRTNKLGEKIGGSSDIPPPFWARFTEPISFSIRFFHTIYIPQLHPLRKHPLVVWPAPSLRGIISYPFCTPYRVCNTADAQHMFSEENMNKNIAINISFNNIFILFKTVLQFCELETIILN